MGIQNVSRNADYGANVTEMTGAKLGNQPAFGALALASRASFPHGPSHAQKVIVAQCVHDRDICFCGQPPYLRGKSYEGICMYDIVIAIVQFLPDCVLARKSEEICHMQLHRFGARRLSNSATPMRSVPKMHV